MLSFDAYENGKVNNIKSHIDIFRGRMTFLGLVFVLMCQCLKYATQKRLKEQRNIHSTKEIEKTKRNNTMNDTRRFTF